jgi:hypothetical protein
MCCAGAVRAEATRSRRGGDPHHALTRTALTILPSRPCEARHVSNDPSSMSSDPRVAGVCVCAVQAFLPLRLVLNRLVRAGRYFGERSDPEQRLCLCTMRVCGRSKDCKAECLSRLSRLSRLS